MKHFIAFVVCVGLVLGSFPSALGESRLFTGKHTYEASPLDNEFSSRVIARAHAKNAILDKMGPRAEALLKRWGFPYNEGYTKSMMSCMTKVKTVKEKQRGSKYSSEVRTKANISKILQDLGTFDRQNIPREDIFANRAVAAEALKEIEEIRKSADTGNQAAYDGAVKKLHATDWYEQARYAGFVRDYDEAFEAYSKTIEFNPKFAGSYYYRGLIYRSHLKKPEEAAEDLETATELFLKYAVAQRDLKAYDRCVGGLDILIRIDTASPEAYYERATCYTGKEQHDRAKGDFRRAARLGHGEAQKLLMEKGIEW